MMHLSHRSSATGCARHQHALPAIKGRRNPRIQVVSSRHRLSHCVASAAAAEAAGGALSSQEKLDLVKAPYAIDEEGCKIASAAYDNKSHPTCTKISIEVIDFPLLLRTITWVFDGMEVEVKCADITTTETGIACNTFLVTDLRGRKLKDLVASELVDRIENIVVSCVPPAEEQNGVEEWRCGNLHISNMKDDKYTEVVVLGEPGHPGFLLELTSVLSGIGAVIHSATIRNDASTCDLPAHVRYDFKSGRLFRFLITDRQGLKLNTSRVSSLVFTYSLVTSKGTLSPTAAPNLEVDLW